MGASTSHPACGGTRLQTRDGSLLATLIASWMYFCQIGSCTHVAYTVGDMWFATGWLATCGCDFKPRPAQKCTHHALDMWQEALESGKLLNAPARPQSLQSTVEQINLSNFNTFATVILKHTHTTMRSRACLCDMLACNPSWFGKVCVNIWMVVVCYGGWKSKSGLGIAFAAC